MALPSGAEPGNQRVAGRTTAAGARRQGRGPGLALVHTVRRSLRPGRAVRDHGARRPASGSARDHHRPPVGRFNVRTDRRTDRRIGGHVLAALCRRRGFAPPQNGCPMPDRQDDLNPGSDLAPFADALKRLAPQPAHLSRDALLFEAGKAAASSRLPLWAWPAATAVFAGLSLVLAAFLVSPSDPIVRYEDRIVYIPQPAVGRSTMPDRVEPPQAPKAENPRSA